MQKGPHQRHAFTVEWATIARVLELPVKVRPMGSTEVTDLVAVWDTGASQTVLSENLVGQLGLQKVGEKTNHTANGERKAGIYYLDILLPNNVAFNDLEVIDGKLACSMLIGMDIITSGDFSLTNLHGKTCMSFEFPSYRTTDFVKQINAGRKTPSPKPKRHR